MRQRSLDDYGTTGSGADAVVAIMFGHLFPWTIFLLVGVLAIPPALVLVAYMAVCMLLGIPKEDALWFLRCLE